MKFTCKVCGSHSYSPYKDLWYCSSCSVLFKDFGQFSLEPVYFKKLDKDATLPKRTNETDIGYDVTSIDVVVIKPGETVMVQTGLSVELPKNTEIQVRPRSGMAKKYGIMVTNSPGTIDTGYRGPCNVLLTNTGKEVYPIAKGDRIAQFVITTKMPYEIIEVDSISSSDRGESGFGDSGK